MKWIDSSLVWTITRIEIKLGVLLGKSKMVKEWNSMNAIKIKSILIMQGITSRKPSNRQNTSKMQNFTIMPRKPVVLANICPKLNTPIASIYTNSSNTITSNSTNIKECVEKTQCTKWKTPNTGHDFYHHYCIWYLIKLFDYLDIRASLYED